MNTILNYGSCCIDHVYQVQHFVAAGETLPGTDYAVFPGGKGLNQSIAIARANGCVIHAGKIGQDGTWLKDQMHNAGVGLDHLLVSDSNTGHAIIQISRSGDNAIIIYGGTNREILASETTTFFADCAKGDLLLLQNEVSCNETAILNAKDRGMQVGFNVAPMTADVFDLPLDLVDYFVINENEGRALAATEDLETVPDRLLEQYPNCKVLLTLGEQGSWYKDATIEIRQAAFDVNMVDSTGAGDTFTGYFFAALQSGTSTQQALTRASAAAALSVTKAGAATSIPSADAVDDFLQSNPI
ncbi:MAG: ribokinase [Gammaproteobacteria bacterium]|jgi:ribokinase|nr:ribokinase [Gammaproteobacteria bacterium]MBT5203720.1 ribokinase [Gammaproteobacteria bacterium]MBT5601765.1 ribokinase [Gammaproteobacteria bacterium]MBT6244130.1 ribokinase [Gammaproteobacteria bacterium]